MPFLSPLMAVDAAFYDQLDLIWAGLQAVPLALAIFLLVTGLGARLSLGLRALTGDRRLFAAALAGAVFALLWSLSTWPLTYLRDVALPPGFGLPAQPMLSWLTESAVGLVSMVLVAGAAAWIPYALMQRAGRFWWLASAAVLAPLAAGLLVASQLWLAPLTTPLKPLGDRQLTEKIETLVERCGFTDLPIFVGGGSDTVVGLGSTQRIVLAERTTRDFNEAEILFTVAHELKHYALHDTWKGIAVLWLLLFSGLWLTDLIGRAVLKLWGPGFRVRGIDDPASLPLGVLIFSVFLIAALPAFNAYARHIETEADRFALELTDAPEAAAAVFERYIVEDGTPPRRSTFNRIFRGTHPFLADRIALAERYGDQRTVGKYKAFCYARAANFTPAGTAPSPG